MGKVQILHRLTMSNHPIKHGDNGGRFQMSHGKPRYLLDAPIKKGENGGHYQPYGRGERRYTLKYKK